MSSSLSVLNLMLFYVLLKNLHMTNKGIVCFLLELNFYFYIYVHDLFQVGFCIWATAFLCGGGGYGFPIFPLFVEKTTICPLSYLVKNLLSIYVWFHLYTILFPSPVCAYTNTTTLIILPFNKLWSQVMWVLFFSQVFYFHIKFFISI